MSKSVISADKSGQLDQLRIQFRPQSVVFPKCCIFKELYFPGIKALYFQARRPTPDYCTALSPTRRSSASLHLLVQIEEELQQSLTLVNLLSRFTSWV